MADSTEASIKQINIEIEPFNDPEAANYYANIVGAGLTQYDIVLIFGQIYPQQKLAGGNKASIRPYLRVTLPPEAAEDLIAKIKQMLEQRQAILKQAAKQKV